MEEMIMALANKVKRLKETKTEIASAMRSKGISVKESDTFRSYADKLRQIDTSLEDYSGEDPDAGNTDDPSNTYSGVGNGGGAGSYGTKYKYVQHQILTKNGVWYPDKGWTPLDEHGNVSGDPAHSNTAAPATQESLNKLTNETINPLKGLVSATSSVSSETDQKSWKKDLKKTLKDYDIELGIDIDNSSYQTCVSAVNSLLRDKESEASSLSDQIKAAGAYDTSDSDIATAAESWQGDASGIGKANVMYAYKSVTVRVSESDADEFTVKFYNGDEELYKVEHVTRGSTIAYEGPEFSSKDPEKIFAGWNPPPVNIRKCMNCYADFRYPKSTDPNEIGDTWMEIAANKHTYEPGQYKWLALPNDIQTDYVIKGVEQMSSSIIDDSSTYYGFTNDGFHGVRSGLANIRGFKPVKMFLVSTNPRIWISSTDIINSEIFSNGVDGRFSSDLFSYFQNYFFDDLKKAQIVPYIPYDRNNDQKTGILFSSEWMTNTQNKVGRLGGIPHFYNAISPVGTTDYSNSYLNDWLDKLASALPFGDKIKTMDKTVQVVKTVVSNAANAEATADTIEEKTVKAKIWTPSVFELTSASEVQIGGARVQRPAGEIDYSQYLPFADGYAMFRSPSQYIRGYDVSYPAQPEYIQRTFCIETNGNNGAISYQLGERNSVMYDGYGFNLRSFRIAFCL